jgi:hypothetical protein
MSSTATGYSTVAWVFGPLSVHTYEIEFTKTAQVQHHSKGSFAGEQSLPQPVLMEPCPVEYCRCRLETSISSDSNPVD